MIAAEPRTSVKADIREILMSDWDPIGVSHVVEAADEYDSYIGGVYRLLASHATAEDLDAHLGQIERDTMGVVSQDASSRTKAIERLLALNVTLADPDA